jgi:hypothetical protein
MSLDFMTGKFDKTKPFATICGAVPDGARYVQNGVRFKANGDPCGNAAPAPKSEPTPDAPKKPQPKPTAGKDDEMRVMAKSLAEEGKEVMEIAKLLGVHHMKVRALLK